MANRIINEGPEEERIVYESDAGRRTLIRYASPVARLIWTVLTIVNVILALRFLLRLVGASTASGFTDLIYTLSAPLVDPFVGILRSTATNSGVAEWTTLIAMVVYWAVAWVLMWLSAVPRAVSKY